MIKENCNTTDIISSHGGVFFNGLKFVERYAFVFLSK